jgi:ribosome-binding protein aMBF1 (putative translation factor)
MTLKIIGFTDSVTECECCGKSELKGTYCIEIDGVELYYGSTCAFKSHGISKEEQKEMKDKFTREQKNKALYEMYIAPLVEYRDALL